MIHQTGNSYESNKDLLKKTSYLALKTSVKEIHNR